MKVLLCDFAQVLLFPKKYQHVPTTLLQDQVREFGSSVLVLNELNTELLAFISGLTGVKKCLFTAGIVHTDPAVSRKIEGVFEHVFTTSQVGFSKSNPQAFRKVVEILAANPRDCFFIDDMASNIEAARDAGLNAAVYTDNTDVIKSIKRWLD